MPLADWEIELAVDVQDMIAPFVPYLVNQAENGRRILSYGLSSHGYDMRLNGNAELWRAKSYHSTYTEALDPKKILEDDFTMLHKVRTLEGGEYVVLPPHGFMLGSSLEWWNIPDDIQVVTYGKSTYARVGLVVNVTPMEAGWSGNLTIEISNTTDRPVVVYLNEGVAQAVFHRGEKCRTSYAERKGKYQGTLGTVVARP